MQEHFYDYLDDGQISASVTQWRMRLGEDGDGVLSVCRQIGENAQKEWEATADLQKSRGRMEESLAQLLPAIERALGDLPAPRGIFAGREDQEKTYGVVCRFLLILERTARTMRTEEGFLASLPPSLGRRKMIRLQDRSAVFSIQAAAKAEGMTEALFLCAKTLKALEAMEEKDEAHLRSLNGLRRLLEERREAEASFMNRARVLADPEHEGAGASPARVSQLLGELRHNTEQTLIRMKQQ